MLWFLTESKHRNVSLRTNQHSLRILSPAQLSLNSQGLIFKLFYQKYFEWKFSDEKFSPRCHPLSYPGYVVQGSTKPKVKQTKPKVKQTKQNQIKPTQTKQNQIKGAKILVWEFFPQECVPESRDFCKTLSTVFSPPNYFRNSGRFGEPAANLLASKTSRGGRRLSWDQLCPWSRAVGSQGVGAQGDLQLFPKLWFKRRTWVCLRYLTTVQWWRSQWRDQRWEKMMSENWKGGFL